MSEVISFDCFGEINVEDLSLCHVSNLNRLRNNRITNEDVIYRAFGYDFVNSSSFYEQIETLFQMAKQRFSRLERVVTVSNSYSYVQDDISEEFFSLRLQICEFLNSLHLFVQKVNCENSLPNDPNDRIFALLMEFLLRVGQISSVPAFAFINVGSVQGNKSNSCSYHLFHLHLDIKWYSVLLLNELQGLNSVDRFFNPPNLLWFWEAEPNFICDDRMKPTDHYASFIIWDLISMSLNLFRKIGMKDYFTSSPFACSCCRDLMTVLLQFLDRRTEDPFWVFLHSAFQIILQDENYLLSNEPSNGYLATNSTFLNVIPNFSNVNRLGFCWWFLLHVTPLYGLDENGIVSNGQRNSFYVKSNYFEVINLLKLTLNTENSSHSESQMRCYLRCCLSICGDWEASSELPLLLWEYFFKRLNNLFMDVGEVITTCNPGKSSSDWVCFVHSLIDDGRSNFNSYHLFLRLIALQLKKSIKMNSTQEWRQIKGRIFSKFHPRKIQELNLNGLHNCFCLFLTLASIADLEDVVGKVCDLLEMMNPSFGEHNKHCLIWRAMFALMIVCEEREQDLSLPARKMAEDFNNLASEMTKKSHNSVQHHVASELLTIYMEGLQDVFERSSSLTLSEYILIASSFSDLLSNVSASDFHLALTALQVVLARQRLILESNSSGDTVAGSYHCGQHEALSDALWTYVLPIIKEKAFGDSPIGILADVAASFSHLLIDSPPKVTSSVCETLNSIMTQFCFGFHSNADFCCRYLSQCLVRPRLMCRMEREFPDCHAQIIRVWMRLGIQLPSTSSQFQELTRFILKLPEASNIFNEVGHEIPSPNVAFIAFLQALDVYHNKNLNQGIAIRRKIGIYVTDVANVLDCVSKRCSSQDVARSYNAFGLIVRHIPSLIYVRSKPDCLLNRVIQTILLPAVVYNHEKQLPSSQLNALKETLPMFVEGLSRIGSRRDQYIVRTIKGVFIHYLSRYPVRSASSSMTPDHPLVTSIVSVLRLHTSSELMPIVFEAICENCFTRKGSSVQLGIGFINEVLLRCTAKQRSDSCELLVTPLLKLLLVLDDVNLKQETFDLVKLLVAARSSSDCGDQTFSFVTVLENFIVQYFTVQTDRLLRVLQLLSSSFAVEIGQLIPTLGGQLNALEKKKGVGCDEYLRFKYKTFVTNIESILQQRRKFNEK